MGVEGKKHSVVPPLPAPTESESTVESTTPTATELGTDLSKPGEIKSSYSLPEDGTPVTIKTRGHKHQKSQTSLLIEYFEGGKSSGAPGSSDQRKPSVRVRLTPSKGTRKSGSDRDHIQITETKSRKASLSRRRTASPLGTARLDQEAVSTLSADHEDAKSLSSYASATEESNVSRNPIDIEIDRSGNVRRRRPASPLIPAADSSTAAYQNPAMSDISAIPTDSFLDGSGPTSSSYRMSESKVRGKSPSRTRDVITGAAAGVAAGMAVDKLRNKKRESRDDDIVVSKSRDKERRKSSKSRSSSVSEKDKYSERSKTPRKRSSGGHAQDSLVSGADTSVLSSTMSPSHRSYDQHSMRSGTSKASSINNPKLLETVEDAIRRLILPELNALKREQSKHKSRRDSTTSSATTGSRDEYASDRRRSSATQKHVETPRDSIKKERRDREARHDFDYSPSQSGVSQMSVEETTRDLDRTPKHSSDRLPAAALGAAAGALATAAVMHESSPSDDKRTRRRRRAELRSRTSESLPHEEYEDSELSVPDPPMPLMASEVGTTMSGMTRTSILSADTDRPHSASEELTPVQEVSRGVLSESSTPTPTRTSRTLQNGLGTQHANISHGDLKALPRRGTGTFQEEEEEEEYESAAFDRQAPPPEHHEYDEEEYDERHEGPSFVQSGSYDYYNTQDVPPPLKYVPYQPERRGLSPIPSVSGYTEGGSEAPNRDSRVTHTSASMSSPEKVERDDRMGSPDSVPSNVMSRGFGDDDRSVRSSGMDYGHAGYNDSEVSRAESGGQAVRAVGANPQIVHPHIAIESLESNVASLVDGSMLDGSVLTNESGQYGQNAGYSPRHSMATLEEERLSHGHATPSKRSVESNLTQQSRHSQRELAEERNSTSVSGSQRSREFAEEYDVDEYGRKVPASKYRQSPTASEAAITLPALTAAAAAIKAAQSRGKGPAIDEPLNEFEGAGVQRNKSFKERAMNGGGPLSPATRHVVDRYDQPKMDFRAMPNYDDHMPEIGHWDDGESVDEAGHQEHHAQAWSGNATPRQQTPVARDLQQQHEQREDVEAHSVHEKGSGHGIGLTEVAAAAAIGTVAGMVATHSRQPSQEQDEEWHRTSDDRKRDTLVTNPYEGASPIVNIPGLTEMMPGEQSYDNAGYGDQYSLRSPVAHNPDEGYISQGPNRTPDIRGDKGKEIDFNPQRAQDDDPFFVTKHSRHMSGMSHGMETPFYDAATGAGIDRIESKDIMALMQHLMVRDAQRSARDTEILVTLVRAAAEMRNSFEDIKRMLADTEDVIITEVKENTDKTVQRAINGPRPFPGSGARSLQSGTMTADDLPAKRRNIFRRALKGLSSGKDVNDLGRIEDMLNQLLTEVDVLKAQTVPGNASGSNHGERSYDNLQHEGAYEQDRGYEPEGNAGTSTASHASQSGHLSIPQSRGASAKLGYDRKFSDHRISTVPEDNEDDYDYQPADEHVHNSNPDMLMTPAVDVQRGASVPLATPPRTAVAAQASMSNENTPRTDKGKKHKSTSSTGWFGIPKISRWSETTTSSVAQAFRRGKKNDDDGHFQSPPSRSGSDLAHYDDEYGPTDPYGEDKLHSGFSEQDLPHEDDDARSGHMSPGVEEDLQAPPTIPAAAHYRMTPEDPKYKAHRDSLNLQHPQPRPGQTELFKATLESQAHEFDSPMSPRSADWAGSATSLHRLPRNANRDSYGSAADQASHQQQQQQQQQYWTSSPGGTAGITTTAAPPRPPKEPLDSNRERSGSPLTRGTPPKPNRISKLAKKQPGSPLPYHSVESGYGTMPSHGAPTASYVSHGHTHSRDSQGPPQQGPGSPRLENRNLSGALGVPSRRPSGPRAMTPKSPASAGRSATRSGESLGGEGVGEGDVERRRKRDTFGTIASQDTDTF